MKIDAGDPNRLSRSEIDEALDALSPADYVRLQRWAERAAEGLAGLSGNDLLQEALVSLLSLDRVWRRGLPTITVLVNAMKGILFNARRRETKGGVDHTVEVAAGEEVPEEGPIPVSRVDEQTDVPALVHARRQLDAVGALVANDEEVGLLVEAWADGLKGREAADALGMDMKTYDAARKRLIRRLARLPA